MNSPITNKVFTPSTYIVAIKTSGNVYSYNAVDELNLKTKSFKDLMDGTPFKKSDIITLQDPQNPEIMAKRDISSFKHLETMRNESAENRKNESKLRHSAASEGVMREIAKIQNTEKESGKKRKTTEEILSGGNDSSSTTFSGVITEDVTKIYELEPLTEDVNPGQVNTDGRAGMSLTSTSSATWTSNKTRRATVEEIREARWKIMRKLGKKAYVQLQTNFGHINLELHCDIAMRTCWNFITLCKRQYYDGTKFHRLVPKFILQGGDPLGTGYGGESAFGGNFRDEFDMRIVHAHRGILSMANSGANTNGSQFFITLNETKSLDLKHTVFGRVVGGGSVVDAIEAVRKLKSFWFVFCFLISFFLFFLQINNNNTQRLERINPTSR
jgi:peptidyl-prolyl cis-trans isomerase-like protein 2